MGRAPDPLLTMGNGGFMLRAKQGRAKSYDSDNLMLRSIMGILLIAMGLLAGIAILGNIRVAAFEIIKDAMQGLGGSLCLGIPLFLVWGGFLVAFSAHYKPPVRAIVLLFTCYLAVLGIITLLSRVGEYSFLAYTANYNRSITPPLVNPAGYWESITTGYALCSMNGSFAGAMGMLTAWPLWTFLGTTGGVVLLGLVCILCVIFFSRFDVVSMVRGFRTKGEEREQKHEVERQRKALLKLQKQKEREQEKNENKATTLADQLSIPAFMRNVKDTAAPVAPAVGVSGAPGVAFANGVPSMPLGGGAAQMAFTQGQPSFAPQTGAPQYMPPRAAAQPGMQTPPMQPQPVSHQERGIYDEIIDKSAGGSTPVKINTPFYRRGATQPEPEAPKTEMPATTTGLFGRDREAEKAMRHMEENRKRKEALEKSLAEHGVTGAASNPAPSDAMPETQPKNGAGTPPASRAARRDAQPPQGEPLTREQIDYAHQVAAYQRPQSAENGASTDRFEAYRKPQGADTPLGQPAVKLPRQQKSEEGKPMAKVKKPYVYPMIELLNLTTAAMPDTREADRQNALRLEETLESFDIPARVQRVTHGPAVTRFELGLISSGINVKRIVNIADNIALDMAANGGVRIEVPIPGTNLFGVEIPNKEIISVSLAEVLTSPEMMNAKSPLSVALGKDIAGRPVICDLAKMPHLLIAGQTGSGKSVCINAIINSLLFRASPDEVRMIMIDPKVVELQGYNKVPHLLIPVVSDPHKAAGALAWAVNEMLDRYHKMQSKGVREITAYNAKVTGDEPRLPRIVIIIDELSDLMLACKKEVEESIIRLAQLARAAGIHVVVATQRPTVNVITGLIKANIPSRISFAVASSVDSRTILDMNGAEQLLGKGDMFYYPTGEKSPLRVQGCYVSDAEINGVADFISNNSDPDYDDRIKEIMEAPDSAETNALDGSEASPLDDKIEEAIEMVIGDGQASISMLQRRLGVGYARAGRLIDDMANRGIIGRSAGSKPREVLISYEQYIENRDHYLR